MSVNERREERERGAILVIMSVVMLTLMVASGMAVDLGASYSERRQDQSAADVASLALAMEPEAPDEELVTMARDIVNETIGEELTEEDFNTCGEDRSALERRLHDASCISVSADRTQARVNLPRREHKTIFGRIVGVETITHTAGAASELEPAGFGGVLPFGILASQVTASGHTCIKTGATAMAIDACTGPDSGNFGPVNIGWHGNRWLNTTVNCDGGGTTMPNGRYIQNIAMGADHLLSLAGRAPHFDNQVVDTYGCPQPRANAVETLTGNQPNVLGAGIFSHCCFADGGPARLQRVSEELTWGQTTSVSGRQLDDNPLWEFIGPEVDSFTMDLPKACERGQFVGNHGGLDEDGDGVMTSLSLPVQTYFATASPPISKENRMMKLMERCFVHYNGLAWDDHGRMAVPDPPVGCIGACTAPVFTRNDDRTDRPDLKDIQHTSRFGYVPGLAATQWPSGSAVVSLATTYPVFLDRLCVGNNASNCLPFVPGFGQTISGEEARANSVTAWVFQPTMLPGRLGDPDAFAEVGLNLFPRLVE